MLAPVVTRHGMANIARTILDVPQKNCEKNIELYFRYADIFYYESGKQALKSIMQALKLLSQKTKVIVQSYTCFSVAKVLADSNLDIVVLDTDPETLDYNYDELVEHVDADTLCIISTHLFGTSADIRRAKNLARKYDAYLIEDAAQKQYSIPEERSVADATIYSFGRGKPISLMGGGILGINNEMIRHVFQNHDIFVNHTIDYGVSTIIRMLLNDVLTHPAVYRVPAQIPFLGIGNTVYPAIIENGCLNKFQRCFLGRKLQQLGNEYAKRKKIACAYTKVVAAAGANVSIIHSTGNDYSPHRYPFYLKMAYHELTPRQSFKAKNNGIVRMYPYGINRLTQLKNKITVSSTYNGEKFISDHLVTAPTHHYVNDTNIEHITSVMSELL